MAAMASSDALSLGGAGLAGELRGKEALSTRAKGGGSFATLKMLQAACGAAGIRSRTTTNNHNP
jgi:hypothetical protein